MGDKLIAYGNKIVTVDNVYTAHEKELICVQTDRGNRIRVSQGHPLLREDGTGIAEDLYSGDFYAQSLLRDPVKIEDKSKMLKSVDNYRLI